MPWLVRMRAFGLGIGIPLSLVATALAYVGHEQPGLVLGLGAGLHDASGLVLSAGYVGWVALWATGSSGALPSGCLAPADVRKEGSAFDLPIAIGILVASEQLTTPSLQDFVLLGELSLDGSLRRCAVRSPWPPTWTDRASAA